MRRVSREVVPLFNGFLIMGYHQFRDSAACASVVVRDLEAGPRVWLLPAWLEEKDETVS